jgi:Uma2 family endonuclease
MSTPLRKSWTQDEFFAWAEAQQCRYEFDGLQPVAMTGGTIAQGIIVQNLQRELGNRLHGKHCQVLPTDCGIETIGKAVRYPDSLITCSPQNPRARTVKDPVVVFEVISASTARDDRIIKVREYAAVSSIRRYVMIESTLVGLSVLERSRADEVWRASTLTGEEVLRLTEVGIELPVAEIYYGLILGEADSSAD